MKISYSFLFTRKVREYYIFQRSTYLRGKADSQEYLFTGKLLLGSIYFLVNINLLHVVNKYWEVIFKGVYIYGDTGTIFKHKGPSCKKKEHHMNSTSNTF